MAGAPGIAAREPRAGQRRARLDPIGLEQLRDPRRRHRAEADALQSRDDRGQKPARRRADEQHVSERGGLLQRLQQSVLGLVVHAVGLDDHEHPALGLERPQRGLAHDLCAHVVDEHLVSAAWLDPREVRMHTRQHAPLGVGGIRGALRDQGGRKGARRLPLAGSRRTVEEVGVAEPVPAQRRLEREPRQRLMLGAREHGAHRIAPVRRASTSASTCS